MAVICTNMLQIVINSHSCANISVRSKNFKEFGCPYPHMPINNRFCCKQTLRLLLAIFSLFVKLQVLKTVSLCKPNCSAAIYENDINDLTGLLKLF